MGAGNSHPMTSKELISYHVNHFRTGGASMQGYRTEMEDALLCSTEIPNHTGQWIAGVFDGHCGSAVSRRISRELPKRLGNCASLTVEEIEQTCLEFDQNILESDDREAGSTAIFVVVSKNEKKEGEPLTFTVKVCNIGDSRCLVIRPDGSFEAFSEDHKPDAPGESERIHNAGGEVRMSRVDGQLALSRAFGDASYKTNASLPQREQKVVALPEVKTYEVKSGDILLLACDGIFESANNEEVAAAVNKFLSEHKGDLVESCVSLLDYSLVRGSKDNMSAQLIRLEEDEAPERQLKEYFESGVHFEKSKTQFKKLLEKEAIHLGLELAAVHQNAVKTDVTVGDVDRVLEELLDSQRLKDRLVLPREPSDDCPFIALPRKEPQAPSDGWGSDQGDGGDDDDEDDDDGDEDGNPLQRLMGGGLPPQVIQMLLGGGIFAPGPAGAGGPRGPGPSYGRRGGEDDEDEDDDDDEISGRADLDALRQVLAEAEDDGEDDIEGAYGGARIEELPPDEEDGSAGEHTAASSGGGGGGMVVDEWERMADEAADGSAAKGGDTAAPPTSSAFSGNLVTEHFPPKIAEGAGLPSHPADAVAGAGDGTGGDGDEEMGDANGEGGGGP
uniref:protein-serine/threonine phosphatase n=1 Tax=Chromera velia CCMP2878 TaxID=1169474 RepID=A0A0G4I3P7_9ALVE|eukprot:Cvel_10719.t1-p1 / transcript=Cvel_10719.t1 / gene=Cvel_10719 / organism=Chromera_velia_CCMP2878 / gene_product=Protein phosphatase 2C, putative / transcript_product=Protein phosphatase 2C, putative / location=Cvel_scaffold652:42007-50787(-) / protein_length=614 / sequence_SO=supercontig / SO=protein_coding / is_pseudo=false